MISENIYNLSFGDWSEGCNVLNDTARTNNGDRNKVLATVAFTALDFTDHFPNSLIYVEGSTPARTRLYQMGIANHLSEINLNFCIFGLRLQKWEPFIPNMNYDAFLAERR